MMIIDIYPFINGKAVVWVKDSVFTEDNSPVVAKCGLINNKQTDILKMKIKSK